MAPVCPVGGFVGQQYRDPHCSFAPRLAHRAQNRVDSGFAIVTATGKAGHLTQFLFSLVNRLDERELQVDPVARYSQVTEWHHGDPPVKRQVSPVDRRSLSCS
jgi:hypothetical protein